MFATHQLNPQGVAYKRRIRRHISQVSGREDAEDAVKYANTLLERGLPVLFDLGHLAHVVDSRPNVLASMAAYAAPHYTTFRVPKRGGGSREIAAPRPALKQVQLWVNSAILNELLPRDACHGFVPTRSIVTNASPHVGADLILKLDIKEFFPSVEKRAVFRVFRRAGYTRPVANLLAGLTTLNGSLPQGAPTSPQLGNFAAYDLDRRLERLAERHGLRYTRYADDLTFSGDEVRRPAVKRRIERIVRDGGFVPNERKAKYLHPHHRQIVTGIVVNDKLNWPRARRRWLRQEIHYLERFGMDDHLGRRGIRRARYKEFIYGHVYALNAVRPAEAQDYIRRLAAVAWPY